MKLKRYRCLGCGLELVVETPPEKCFCCGSTDIAREGWKQRYKRIQEAGSTARR